MEKKYFLKLHYEINVNLFNSYKKCNSKQYKINFFYYHETKHYGKNIAVN